MLILSYYLFTEITDPESEITAHQEFLNTFDVTCRIYISHEGINGSLSAPESDAKAYMDWMANHPTFHQTSFKIEPYHEHVFPRKSVKLREHLVGMDQPADPAKGGKYLKPHEWKQELENSDKKLFIDVRNTYETAVGHFKGSLLPPCDTFREFIPFAEELKKTHGTNTPIRMCCTGGIRCELYSAILKEKGFEDVAQLEGGIINYGKEVGSDHWEGKLFVFDDRMTVPISDEETPVIGKCHHCQESTEAYYNCANMDCNELFLSCPDCLKKFSGCCQAACQDAPRVRPYHEQNPHKPFRKKRHYLS